MAATHRNALALLALAVVLALTACGNKGSLVRPPLDADVAPAVQDLPPATEPSEADPPSEIEPPPAADPPSDPSTAPADGDIDGDG